MKKKIAIIGAGISGLVLANLLKQKSKYEFVLYEKNNSINFNSYGIQLAVNSVDILNKIGFENFDADEKYNPNNAPAGVSRGMKTNAFHDFYKKLDNFWPNDKGLIDDMNKIRTY